MERQRARARPRGGRVLSQQVGRDAARGSGGQGQAPLPRRRSRARRRSSPRARLRQRRRGASRDAVTPRSLALVLGLVYLGLGALGLMPGVLAGLFPASPVLAVAHLALGAWGLAAYAGRTPAALYARRAAMIFAVLGLAGMLNGLERFPIPLHGANVWLHLASAALAGDWASATSTTTPPTRIGPT